MSFLNSGEQFAGSVCKLASGCSILIWFWDILALYQSQIVSITAIISTIIALIALIRDRKNK